MKLGPHELGYNDISQGIYTGDAKLLCEEIPDESIDLIFTDPVYQNMDDYAWLAEMASRKLVRGGNLIAQTGHYYLPQVLAAMSGKLDYVWILAEKLSGGQSSLFKYRLTCSWKPYLWFSKGPRVGRWVFDWFKGGGISKQFHAWQDSPQMFLNLIDRLTTPNSIVLDPFTGGGTVPAACKMLSRPYLAFEINPRTATIARNRLIQTPIPLPLIAPTQPNLL